jgi:hypothetical protein
MQGLGGTDVDNKPAGRTDCWQVRPHADLAGLQMPSDRDTADEARMKSRT